MKFARTTGFSSELTPKMSMRVSPPFEGGVALVEIAAASTCGIDATASRSFWKYAVRSAHVW